MSKYLRSATTKPTGKKRFEAGKKGKAVKARPIITMQEWLLEAAGKLATLSEATKHFGEPFSLCQRQVPSIWRKSIFLDFFTDNPEALDTVRHLTVFK